MLAMVLDTPGARLRPANVPDPKAGPGEVVVRVAACGVCRTDLHVVDGELTGAKRPLIPGHEIVGTVVDRGQGAVRFAVGDRIGVPWLASTCGVCEACRGGRENLCDAPQFTGYTRDGGYAELAAADERFCFAIPPEYSDIEAAPLLCAGLIGYRSLMMTGDARRLGIYGFAPRHTSLPRLPAFKAGRFSRSRGPATARARNLPASWARFGQATRMAPRRNRWTRPLSMHPSVRSSRRPWLQFVKVERSSAPGFT